MDEVVKALKEKRAKLNDDGIFEYSPKGDLILLSELSVVFRKTAEDDFFKETKRRMEGDIYPEKYWNVLNHKNCPDFPKDTDFYNALVDFVISVWGEVETYLEEDEKILKKRLLLWAETAGGKKIVTKKERIK